MFVLSFQYLNGDKAKIDLKQFCVGQDLLWITRQIIERRTDYIILADTYSDESVLLCDIPVTATPALTPTAVRFLTQAV